MTLSTLNETAHKILDVAESFTQTQGFNAFSYKDIQAEVGVKTSSIHYYFPTKQDLAAAMAERYIERFLKALDGLDRKNITGFEKLSTVGGIFVDVAEAQKLCLCGMLTSDILSLPADGLSELKRFYKETERWMARAIAQGIEEGDFKESLPVEDTAACLLATLEGGILIARARTDGGYMQTVLDQALAALKK